MVRLSTVGFTVVSLCLKESLAMLTRGHFVCHVHCLVHDGVVRSSPCGPHHENFGRNLYHMFVPAYSASQSIVFVLSCGIRVALKSNVDSIFFLSGVLILRCEYKSFMIIEIVMSILFNRCVFSSSGFVHFQRPQDQLSVLLNDVCFIRPKLPLFFLPTLPFSSRTQIS